MFKKHSKTQVGRALGENMGRGGGGGHGKSEGRGEGWRGARAGERRVRRAGRLALGGPGIPVVFYTNGAIFMYLHLGHAYILYTRLVLSVSLAISRLFNIVLQSCVSLSLDFQQRVAIVSFRPLHKM